MVIDHGAPWASYCTHLSSVFVQPTKRGQSGERVVAGQPIGLIGDDPLNPSDPMHLHCELWFQGAHDRAIDPASMMRAWPVLMFQPSQGRGTF